MPSISDGMKDSANTAKAAGQGTTTLAKKAKKIKKKYKRNPKVVGIWFGVALSLILLAILIGGISSSQLSNTYYLTPLNAPETVKPKTDKDAESSITNREEPISKTEELVSIIREYKDEERSSLDSQIVKLANEMGADPDLTLSSVKEELEDAEVYEIKGADSYQSLKTTIVKLGEAVSGEKGLSGNKPGDQTGKEVYIRNWYSNSWTVVYRCKDPSKAAQMAKITQDACKNDNIGFDNGTKKERTSFYKELEAAGFSASMIKNSCETADGQFIAAGINGVGIEIEQDLSVEELNKTLAKNENFEVHKEAGYLTNSTKLQPGDILISTSGTKHAAMVTSTPTGCISNGGCGSAEGADVITVSKQDMDVLSAYSVSLANSLLTVDNPDEANKKISADGERDDTTYVDRQGNGVSLYWFGEKKGQVNYAGDLKKKIATKRVRGFYKISNGGVQTVTDEDGKRVKYLQITIKESKSDELSKELFDIKTEEPYVNADINEKIKEEKEKDPEYNANYVTNTKAIKDISENTVHLIYEGADVSETGLVIAGNGTLPNPLGKAKYTITSTFGAVGDCSYHMDHGHAGLDMAAPTGTPIYASMGGTVKIAGWYGGYGLAVVIQSGDYEIIYGHASKVLVHVGQTVPTGKNIALVGSTGNSTGPHLHFEVHYKGKTVDPLPLIKKKQ